METLAIVRDVSPAIARCELTHLARVAIDYATARLQHDEYTTALARLGCSVQRVGADSNLPDSVFIEDVAVVFPELAVVTRPGAVSRRLETTAVAVALEPYRPLAWIHAPGTIDGGDVLLVRRTVFVGVSGRTNQEGVAQ